MRHEQEWHTRGRYEVRALQELGRGVNEAETKGDEQIHEALDIEYPQQQTAAWKVGTQGSEREQRQPGGGQVSVGGGRREGRIEFGTDDARDEERQTDEAGGVQDKAVGKAQGERLPGDAMKCRSSGCTANRPTDR